MFTDASKVLSASIVREMSKQHARNWFQISQHPRGIGVRYLNTPEEFVSDISTP
jgi:hypothetical protein